MHVRVERYKQMGRYLPEIKFLVSLASYQVSAARAPVEGAVCALFRSASNDCARHILPALVARMTREPLPAALPHALLQRIALHHLVDLIFDPDVIGVNTIFFLMDFRRADSIT